MLLLPHKIKEYMNLNSGTKLLLIIFLLSLALLLILLIIFGLVSKKTNKLPKATKPLTIVAAIIMIASSILTPLAHYNYIPINLKFGYFNNVVDETNKLKINRDSIEYMPNYGDIKKGKYTLVNDILTISYKDGSTMEFEVKGMGTDLYKDGVKVYSYVKDTWGLN